MEVGVKRKLPMLTRTAARRLQNRLETLVQESKIDEQTYKELCDTAMDINNSVLPRRSKVEETSVIKMATCNPYSLFTAIDAFDDIDLFDQRFVNRLFRHMKRTGYFGDLEKRSTTWIDEVFEFYCNCENTDEHDIEFHVGDHSVTLLRAAVENGVLSIFRERILHYFTTKNVPANAIFECGYTGKTFAFFDRGTCEIINYMRKSMCPKFVQWMDDHEGLSDSDCDVTDSSEDDNCEDQDETFRPPDYVSE